jgi:uncharacterized protein YheU (UPF0270 family)
MRIPYTRLAPATLRAVVQEFVTRDGTDHSCVEQRIESVLRQLEAGRVELHFDEQTETCNILAVEADDTPSADDSSGRR